MSLLLKRQFVQEFISKSQPKSTKSPRPTDVRRSKTSLLKLPIDVSVTDV